MSAPLSRSVIGQIVPEGAQTLTQSIVPLGFLVVDLAAAIDGIDDETKASLSKVATLRLAGTRISSSIEAVTDAIEDLSQTTAETETAAADRLAAISENTQRFERMAEWGTDISGRTYALEGVLKDIVKGNGEIARIARQVNILAVNASIEAARAGEAGRGFAIVAEAISDLSRKTADAVRDISGGIEALDTWTQTMRQDAERHAPDFELGLAGAVATRQVIEGIAADMTGARAQIRTVQDAIHMLAGENRDAQPVYDAIETASNGIAQQVTGARTGAGKMMDACETLLQRAAELDESGPDSRFIARATELAARVAQAMEDGLRAGLITQSDLFDFRYTPIPHTAPQQHDAPFARFTDQTIQDILEEALSFDPAVMFCCACDRNGYIPTHNLKFSRAPGSDPEWNNANCRNRRIFSDRTGRKAGANRAPFLMQVYRRDMGVQGFVLMKDISAPIHVAGRHWGGLRLGYRND